MSSENTLFPLPDTLLRPMVEQALSEDLGRRGDITSAAVIAPDKTAKLFLVSREDVLPDRLISDIGLPLGSG